MRLWCWCFSWGWYRSHPSTKSAIAIPKLDPGHEEYTVSRRLHDKRHSLLTRLGGGPIVILATAIRQEIGSIEVQVEQSVTHKDYAAAEAIEKMKASLLMGSEALPTRVEGMSIKARASDVQALIASMENTITATAERKAYATAGLLKEAFDAFMARLTECEQ